MLDFWTVTFHPTLLTRIVHMKKESIYMGGEKDPQNVIMPKYFEIFFNKSFLFFVLVLLLALLLFIKLNM